MLPENLDGLQAGFLLRQGSIVGTLLQVEKVVSVGDSGDRLSQRRILTDRQQVDPNAIGGDIEAIHNLVLEVEHQLLRCHRGGGHQTIAGAERGQSGVAVFSILPFPSYNCQLLSFFVFLFTVVDIKNRTILSRKPASYGDPIAPAQADFAIAARSP